MKISYLPAPVEGDEDVIGFTRSYLGVWLLVKTSLDETIRRFVSELGFEECDAVDLPRDPEKSGRAWCYAFELPHGGSTELGFSWVDNEWMMNVVAPKLSRIGPIVALLITTKKGNWVRIYEDGWNVAWAAEAEEVETLPGPYIEALFRACEVHPVQTDIRFNDRNEPTEIVFYAVRPEDIEPVRFLCWDLPPDGE